ncbi:flagellar hook-length control protein FliK [Rhodovastum atsumiense]|uniref:flagellar hook-length control protein FliK n=1 Tax=Rhodovastum atsumiense TaxID=504468 RepID=UPI0020246CA2|nr:flagellar hook-length control protein FliK [Rhodovastum atsumiense]
MLPTISSESNIIASMQNAGSIPASAMSAIAGTPQPGTGDGPARPEAMLENQHDGMMAKTEAALVANVPPAPVLPEDGKQAAVSPDPATPIPGPVTSSTPGLAQVIPPSTASSSIPIPSTPPGSTDPTVVASANPPSDPGATTDTPPVRTSPLPAGAIPTDPQVATPSPVVTPSTAGSTDTATTAAANPATNVASPTAAPVTAATAAAHLVASAVSRSMSRPTGTPSVSAHGGDATGNDDQAFQPFFRPVAGGPVEAASRALPPTASPADPASAAGSASSGNTAQSTITTPSGGSTSTAPVDGWPTMSSVTQTAAQVMAHSPAQPATVASTASSTIPSATGQTDTPVPPHLVTGAGEMVAVRVARALQDGSHTVTVALHPEELGRVEVRLSFRDNGVGVQMMLDRRETFEAFNRDRPAIEQQLAQAGIDLGSGGLDLRFGRQPADSGTPLAQSHLRFSEAEPETVIAPPPTRRLNDSLVDILA